MVAVIRTWNWDENFVIATGGGFDEQARRNWLRAHELVNGDNGVDVNNLPAAAGAWTVVNSSPGDGTVGAGDNIVDLTDIVFDSPGSNHTWAEYSQAGLIPGQTTHMVFDLADTTPFNSATVVLMPAAPTVPGTATNRPTHPDEIIVANSVWFPDITDTPRTFLG